MLEAQDNPENYNKYIVCPNCHQKNKFSEFKRIRPHIPSEEEDVTQLISKENKEAIGFLIDENGRRYSLKEGRNLIGRMTYKTPPPATVPITTSDREMSRAHLFIEVVQSRDGHYHAYAYNASNKNITKVNGEILVEGDKLGLKHQDNLLLANTKLIYVGAEYDDDTEL